MLTRLFIDNYRCFVNFEYKPLPKQLILGSNGAGKSSLVDALLLIRQFVTKGDAFSDLFMPTQRTRWLSRPQMTFELEAALEGGNYTYDLVLEPAVDSLKTRVSKEIVRFDGKPVFEFISGEVRLYNDRFEHKVSYDFDWQRPALATITPRHDNQVLTRFKTWVSNLFCFRLNPFAMSARAESEQLYANLDLSNFASWYRHLVQADPKSNAALLSNLSESLADFDVMQFEVAGENVRLLVVGFKSGVGSKKFFLNELSDGQRCLICLYTILSFLVSRGCTVLIDEPENFISLREIQPWLMAISDAVDAHNGQIFLISHHPEIINQWAPVSGVEFIRQDDDSVRAMPFAADLQACLPPAELIARGWHNE